VTALFELTLALAAADRGPGQGPGDAGMPNVEQEASPVAPLVLGEALLEVNSRAQVVAGMFKRAGEVQQVDDGAGHEASATWARSISLCSRRQLVQSDCLLSGRIGREQVAQSRRSSSGSEALSGEDRGMKLWRRSSSWP
jgi:hypothetical protein